MSGSVGTLTPPAGRGRRLLCTIVSLRVSLCHGPLACHPPLRGPYISSLHVLLAYLLCWNILTMSPTSGGFQVTPDQRICLRSAHLSYGQPQGDFPIHGDSTFKDQPSPALRFPSQQARAWVQAGGSTVEPLSQGRG